MSSYRSIDEDDSAELNLDDLEAVAGGVSQLLASNTTSPISTGTVDPNLKPTPIDYAQKLTPITTTTPTDPNTRLDPNIKLAPTGVIVQTVPTLTSSTDPTSQKVDTGIALTPIVGPILDPTLTTTTGTGTSTSSPTTTSGTTGTPTVPFSTDPTLTPFSSTKP